MAQQSTEVLEASPTDIASDMAYHRQTWLRFLKLMKWVAIGSAIILIIVFFIMY